MSKVKIFENQQIRSHWDAEKEQWYFSVIDIIQVLTGSERPRKYWSDLKRKILKQGSQLSDNIGQLKMLSADGKFYLTDIANTETLLRLIQSIPSPNAEPFKLWLAQVGYERLEENEDPELTIDRALEAYLAKGYSKAWINQRLKSIEKNMSITIGYLLVMTLTFSSVTQAEIYKYQDANGKWQFTDKKPKKVDAERVNYKSNEKKKQGPEFTIDYDKGLNYFKVKNPFYAPMVIELISPQVQGGKKEWLIAPQSSLDLIQTSSAIEPYKYRWQLGDPNASPAQQHYQFPVQMLACTHISQSFNGRFSHTKDHSRYAVDIAMNVGTPIVAARAGTVVGVKDDYHMGGVNEYFLDKGNYVSVIHDDGTFASYFHILLGTAAVKPGAQIQAGQLLAKSGSSGFSSGPHLHFVINRNAGFRQLSIPFKFVTKNGNAIEPTQGLKICDQLIQQ